jgi:type III secretion apparatus needle protein
MTDVSTINRQTIFDDGGEKLTKLETDLETLINTVTDKSKEIDQKTMLALQFQMQRFTLFVQTIASVQKEFSDMLKGIVSKF